MTTPALFTPIQIGQHTLKHRIVMAPLTRFRADPATSAPVPDMVSQYYHQRATAGGLIITEATAISPGAGAPIGTPGIYNAEQIKAWQQVTTAVHKKGGVIFMQMWHLGRAGSNPVSASDLAIASPSPLGGGTFDRPRALSVDGILAIIQEFVQAAKNAMEAGFDGVEIHAGNGYLLDQFIQASSNKRTDEYGGSTQNRTRMVIKVVTAVAQAIGDSKTALRLSPWSDFHDMNQGEPTVDTWGYLTRQLETHHPRLAYLHFVESRINILEDDRPDGNVDDPTCSLDPFRALWSGPFISAGNYRSQSAYDRAEKSPKNLVAMGRVFISNPDLVDRVRNHWTLSPYCRATFYSPGPDGYLDYPYYTPTPQLE